MNRRQLLLGVTAAVVAPVLPPVDLLIVYAFNAVGKLEVGQKLLGLPGTIIAIGPEGPRGIPVYLR